MVSSLPPLLKMSYTLSTTFVMTRRSTVGTETVWAPATPANRRRIPPTANTPLATAPSLRTRRRSMGSLPVAVSLQLYGLLRAPRRDDLPTAGRAAARLGRITCLSASRPRKARTKDTRQSARRPIPPPSDPPVHLRELPDRCEHHLVVDQLTSDPDLVWIRWRIISRLFRSTTVASALRLVFTVLAGQHSRDDRPDLFDRDDPRLLSCPHPLDDSHDPAARVSGQP